MRIGTAAGSVGGVAEVQSMDGQDWQELLAVGMVAGNLTPAGIARFAQVHVAEAEAAVAAAVEAGVLREDGTTDDSARAHALSILPLDRVAEVHAAAARHYFAAGPDLLIEAVAHARAAGTLLPLDELVTMADHGGRLALSLGDYTTAESLLSLAAEFDSADSYGDRSQRLCDLAEATNGLGRIEDARRYLATAVQLAELAGDGALAARAAVAFALPVAWSHGNVQASGLLQRAEKMPLSTDDALMVQSAQALVDMRVPVNDKAGEQVAWLARPAVSRPMADEVLAASLAASPEARLLALLAWRATHNAPEFLAQRREVSLEALSLAQRVRNPSMQVEAAVRLAVDAVESADRSLYDESLGVARWVAERDRNPRLQWWALTLAAGAAHLDRDMPRAADLLDQARAVGGPLNLPGILAAELMFVGQTAIKNKDTDVLAGFLFDGDNPLLSSAVARAGASFAAAVHGQPDVARAHVQRAIQLVDKESTYLGVLSVAASTTALIDDAELALELVDLLEPWSAHVAIDTYGWWCVGPVALQLAELHHLLGNGAAARRYLESATPAAMQLNDVHALGRSTALAAELRGVGPQAGDTGLTERELEVLRLMAAGSTNPQIAASLSYSLSTIRTDTVSIYQKLSVGGRTEAVLAAIRLGLIDAQR